MAKLQSRKLWVAILTILTIVTGRAFDVDVTADAMVTVVATVYVLAQGWVDSRESRTLIVGRMANESEGVDDAR